MNETSELLQWLTNRGFTVHLHPMPPGKDGYECQVYNKPLFIKKHVVTTNQSNAVACLRAAKTYCQFNLAEK